MLLHCNSHLNSCSEVARRSSSVIKVGVVDIDVRVLSHLNEELTWAIDKRLRVISTVMLFKNSKSSYHNALQFEGHMHY